MSVDWVALQGAIAGEVVRPGSPGYERARKPAIARFHDSRPEAVVFCASAGDVSEAIVAARRFGLAAVARSGGHCFAGTSSTAGMVIDVTPMRSVSVAGGVATTGAGARLGAVYEALDGEGLTIPAGCGPDVGIAGLTLGGGLGILGRRYGLTCDGLLAARVVRADGRVIECDGDHASDLFWALRGAGTGTFGGGDLVVLPGQAGSGGDGLPPELAVRSREPGGPGLAEVGAGRAGRACRQLADYRLRDRGAGGQRVRGLARGRG
jgi:hypothetical protein